MMRVPARPNRRRFVQGFAGLGLAVAGASFLPGCGNSLLPAALPTSRPSTVHRIGFLTTAGPTAADNSSFQSFVRDLQALGYVEGQNVSFEYRAEGSGRTLSDLAAELVRQQVAVIVVDDDRTLLAAKQAGGDAMPIVVRGAVNLLDSGLIDTLTRPGGNVTGLHIHNPQLSQKRLELLTEAAPTISRVVAFWNPDNPRHRRDMAATVEAARLLHVELVSREVRSPAEVRQGIDALRSGHAEALLLFYEEFMDQAAPFVTDFGRRYRLPSMFDHPEFIDRGGLMAYVPDWERMAPRAASHVDQILRGSKPGEIPVEQPTHYALGLNLKTAQDIGLTLPKSMLLQASRTIGVTQTGRRIGVLEVSPQALRAALRRRGYVDGENLTIDWRNADGRRDLLRQDAADLVRLNVEVLVTVSTPAVQAAREATDVTPIVMAIGVDPVALGLAETIERPGGNVTGLTNWSRQQPEKSVELLQTIVPGLRRIAVLKRPSNASTIPLFNAISQAATARGLETLALDVEPPEELPGAFARATREGVGALSVGDDPGMSRHMVQIVQLAAAHRLPTIYRDPAYINVGGLMTYSGTALDLDDRIAHFVDALLRGANPAELPIEEPRQFNLAINLSVAHALGLEIPDAVLAQATKIVR